MLVGYSLMLLLDLVEMCEILQLLKGRGGSGLT